MLSTWARSSARTSSSACSASATTGSAREGITGRRWLLAPKPVLDAWLRLIRAGNEIAFHEAEIWQPEPGFDRPMPPRTDLVVAAAEQALEQVRMLLRAQVDAG